MAKQNQFYKQNREKIKTNNKVEQKSTGISERNRIIIYIIIVAVVFVPIYNSIFDKKVALLGDNASYYILAKAISNGDGFVNTNIISKPKASQFPPGYPAFMASVMKVFNDEITTMKVANGFLFFLSLVILFFFFRNISKNIHLSFIITLALIFNMHLLQYSTIMMSEIPFIFISSLALLLLSKINFEKKPWKDSNFILMIFVVAATYYVRGQGLAMFVAMFIYLLIEKKWLHLAISSVGYFLLLLPWQIRNSDLGESAYSTALRLKNYYNPDEGVMHFSDWISRFFVNLERYMKFEIPSSMFGYEADYQTAGSLMLGIFAALFVIFGIFKLKKFKFAVLAYIFATFGILFLWPEIWNGIRFILALVPLLVFLFYYGIYSLIILISEKLKLNNAKFLANILPFFFIISIFVFVNKMEELQKKSSMPMDPLFKNYFAVAKWTKNNLPDSAVIICRKPDLFYLDSKHFTDGFTKVSDIAEFLNSLDKKKTTHIVVFPDGITQRYFVPVYEKNPEKFPVIQQFTNPDVWLLEYKPLQGYNGEWKDGKKQGKGSFLFPNNNKYIGQWLDDKMNGQGTIYDAVGKILQKGIWENGQFKKEN